MKVGSVFFDREFQFHDGETGEKLFVILGTDNGITVVAKTTSQQHGRGNQYGCQPHDRFHNFYLPLHSCYFKKPTWVCLDEFFELNHNDMLQKRFSAIINPVCDLDDNIAREIQVCALQSLDISGKQETIITQSMN